jgi:hypothetical protein
MSFNIARPKAITKVLSRNDTGETGGHQAGILVPKDPQILSFFPSLDSLAKNPRVRLNFMDPQGKLWGFTFIYYNNSRFGGTRNEYRLTWMTAFIHNFNLKTGDRLTLIREDNGNYCIDYQRQSNIQQVKEENSNYNINNESKVSSPANVLKLGTSWKIVRI